MKLFIFTLTIFSMIFLGCQGNSKKTNWVIQDNIQKAGPIVNGSSIQYQDTTTSESFFKKQPIHKSKHLATKPPNGKQHVNGDISINKQNLTDSSLIIQTHKSNIANEGRLFLPATPISELIDKVRPELQTFNLQNWRDTILVSNTKSTFAIGKNSFINSNGQIPKTVTIQILEVNSIADIIAANLQTASHDRILQTGGMFFIDAKENNASLELMAGKTIYVDLKTKYKDSKMMFFNGTFNHAGTVNWIQSGIIDNRLLPIPIHLLNFQNGGIECSLSKKQIDLLNKTAFNNTFIATREFEARTSSVMNIAACEQFNDLAQKLIDVYTGNIDQNLFHCDSLAADLVYEIYKKKIDTTREFSFNDSGWVSYFYKTFIDFKNQRLGKAINFGQMGVSETTTAENLIAKGYSEMEAISIINCFKTQQQLIKYRKTVKSILQLASYSFSIAKLGWTNVDQFLEEGYLRNSDFAVQTSSQEHLDFVSVSLVIPRYNVSIFSIHQEGSMFSFTKKKDGYRKLPVGQEAIIVAISYKDNKSYFGKQKITIPENGIIGVHLDVMTEQTIKREILKLTD